MKVTVKVSLAKLKLTNYFKLIQSFIGRYQQNKQHLFAKNQVEKINME